MLRKDLHKRRVVERDLLQDGLDGLRVLLHQLTKLLNLRVILDGRDVDVATRVDGHGDASLAARCGWCWGILLLLLGELR